MKSSKRFKAALITAGALVILAGGLAISELTNTTHIFHKKAVPATIPVETSKTPSKAKKSSASGSSSNSTQTSAQGDKVAASNGGNTDGSLVQPSGNFVSNHYPGQNGTDTKEQSVCNTTPGARCYIQFTNTSTGQVTKLPELTTENDGSALWLWDASILSSGQWEIKAVASLNGQTKSAADSIKLNVP